MSLQPMRADMGLGGLMVLVFFVLLQILNAFRRGKPPEPVPTAARPAKPSRPSYSPKIRDGWAETPQLVPSAPAPAPEVEEAVRRLEAAEAALGADPVSPHAWSQLRIRGREEWQRGVILSEILQRPLSLRPDW